MATMTKTTAGLNLERDAKSGATISKVFYIALGDSATTPSAADTTLGNERFRKAISTFADSTTGKITAQVYIAPTEAVGITVAEVGIFGGSGASSTPNSGVLIGHGLYSPTHTKTMNESMVIPIDITYS